MTEPTSMHQIGTSLPDDLFERFEEERAEAVRNVSQHLRAIVRDYYRMLDARQRATVPVPRASQDTRIMPAVLPTEPRKLEPWKGVGTRDTKVIWDDDASMTVESPNDPHKPRLSQ